MTKQDTGALARDKTLLDEFAGKAMGGMCACQGFLNEVAKTSRDKEEVMEKLSRWAYKYAAAMITEKRRREGNECPRNE